MPHHNILFLKQRIYEIGSALLYCLNTGTLRIPATIINVLSVDNYGNLYTLIQRPEYDLTEAEMQFPVLLKLYKKGKPFFMEIQGLAVLLNDGELFNQLMHQMGNECTRRMENIIIVKLKMETIYYYEWKQPSPGNGIKGLIAQFFQWIRRASSISFSLNLNTLALQQRIG
ncbi:hypothetical protein [Agriterribacter sp.]|uniref:hypothetical protein n=1 Tax=Agriterribacter sp. TaxID=2821509 RepID=UPI002D03EDE7|nr:hypothetical protein [Agriterribacter sp.]HRO44369.1 hypothetical protein [Agriterribacter sp.]HRQ16685.1 hypothetical protein [Agriterribacter sp.]